MIRLDEMARQLDETAVTVRYWTDWFGVPVKRGPGGARLFDADCKTALFEVKRLIRYEGHTIAGAKKKLGIT